MNNELNIAIKANPVATLDFASLLSSQNLLPEQYLELGKVKPEQWASLVRVMVHEHNIDVPKGITLEKPDSTDFSQTQSILTGVGVAVGALVVIVGAALGLAVTLAGAGATFLAGLAVAAAVITVLGTLLGGFLYLLSWIIQPELISGLEVGGKGGTLFRDQLARSNTPDAWLFKDYPNSSPADWEICKIEIWSGNVIDAIRCTWRGRQNSSVAGCTVIGPKHGGGGGSLHTVSLETGEYIRRIHLKVGIRVDSIVIETNRRTTERIGGLGGDREYTFFGPVTGFYGRCGNVIDAIGVENELYNHNLLAYGGNGGVPFIMNLSEMRRIRRINVWHGAYIDGIQIHWEKESGEIVMEPVYGGYPGQPGGIPDGFELNADEYITAIDVRSDAYVDHLTFTTSHGRVFDYGGSGGNPQPRIQLDGKKIYAMVGRYTKYIDNFGVLID